MTIFPLMKKIYHQEKILLAEDKGINLIRITEEEWKQYPNLIKSIIRARLGVIEKKIFARKCKIKEVASKEARLFFDRTHISGYSVANHYIGLEYEGKIQIMCSFSKSRFDKEYQWEIIRLSSELDTIVVGGFQKILNYFRSQNPGSIMTYADRRISSGGVYTKCGFDYVRLTSPGYIWTDGINTYSRYQTQKSKLKKLLKKYDPNLTEQENMFQNRFRLYYDCGHLKYILN